MVKDRIAGKNKTKNKKQTSKQKPIKNKTNNCLGLSDAFKPLMNVVDFNSSFLRIQLGSRKKVKSHTRHRMPTWPELNQITVSWSN